MLTLFPPTPVPGAAYRELPATLTAPTCLHGVHRNVDASVQQGVVNLLCEQALAANVGQRLVQDLVARGLDDDDLKGAILVQLGERLLRAGWAGRAGAEGQRMGGTEGGARAPS